MLKASILFAGLVAGVAAAQTIDNLGPVAEPLSTEMFSCWTSGSGSSYMKLCVSKHGNLVMFQSPSGKEHIRVGNTIEGYTVCYYDPANGGEPTEYKDFGYSETGWQEPYKVQQPGGANTLPLTIYRKSTDGKVELVQAFARDTAENDLTITMTAYNRSNGPLGGLGITRDADLDLGGTSTNDIFMSTAKSVIAFDASAGAVSLTNASPVTALVGAWPFATWRDQGTGTCGGSVSIDPPGNPSAPGDYVATIKNNWWGNTAKNASRVLKLVYRVQ